VGGALMVGGAKFPRAWACAQKVCRVKFFRGLGGALMVGGAKFPRGRGGVKFSRVRVAHRSLTTLVQYLLKKR